jgi:gliding motility-associated-like protein
LFQKPLTIDSEEVDQIPYLHVMRGRLLAFAAAVAVLCNSYLSAQDIGISSFISPPVGGCNLGMQNVQMYLYNYSAFPLAGAFNVSYTVNGGPPVNEVVVTSVGPSASYLFTFSTQADLTAAGTYLICGSVSLAGDINPANDNLCISVVNDVTVVPGSISGPTDVCASGNSGTLTLSGYVGYPADWEYSTNGGASWTGTGVGAPTYNFNNLTQTTVFRVLIDGGYCADAYSPWFTVNVDHPSDAGLLVGAATVCALGNTGQIDLVGYTGTTLSWEESTDGGATWNPIANTTAQHTYNNLVTNTQFYVEVQNGVCPPVFSNSVTITVSDTTEGGVVASNMAICSGNSDTLVLTTNVGTVQYWISSTDGGTTWTNISNTTPIYIFPALVQSTQFAAVVQSGVCPADTSLPALVTVNTAAFGGFLSASDTVCQGTTGTLNLIGNIGPVASWITSTNGGATWSAMALTDSSYTYPAITQSTVFAVVVTNPGCPSDTSEYAIITVDTPSDAGTISATSPVCQGSSNALTVSGQNGSILFWTYSNDGGVTWNTISNQTSTQTYTNIQLDREYGVIVQNGVCPADTAWLTIVVLPAPSANAGPDSTIYLGNNIQLQGSGGVFYVWTPAATLDDPNIASPVATPAGTTTYTVQVTDANNCVATDQVLITVVDTNAVLEPVVATLMSPNNDGLNDTWNIIGIQDFPNTDVMVWNNHGQLVFEKTNYANTWKGDFNGNDLPDGSYFYVVEARDINKTYKGILTILRAR